MSVFTLLSVSTAHATPYETAIIGGANWLKVNQNSNGSWDDELPWSTSESALALQNQEGVDTVDEIGRALQWIQLQEVETTEFTARTTDIETLLSLQNKDGGWGHSRHYRSNGIDTCLALEALKNTDPTDAVDEGIDYLLGLQGEDGVYGTDGISDPLYTALASGTMGKVSFRLIDGNLHFNEQAYKSGFESSYSLTQNLDLLDKNTEAAEALVALVYNGHFPERDQLADALVENQNADGSWGFLEGRAGTAYPTALALQALEEYEQAISGVTVDEITLEKDGTSITSGTSLPAGASYTLSAKISNLAEVGRTNVIVVGKIVKDGSVVKVIPPDLIQVLPSGSFTTSTAEVSTDYLSPGAYDLVVETRDSEGRVLHSKEVELDIIETKKVRILNLDVSPPAADIKSMVTFYFDIENTGNRNISDATLEIQLLAPDQAVIWSTSAPTSLNVGEHKYVEADGKLYTAGLGYGTYPVVGTAYEGGDQLQGGHALATLSVGPRVSATREIDETEFPPGNSTAAVNITIEGNTGKPPADVAILVDSTNESVQALEDVKTALGTFIDSLERGDRVGVVSISEDATLLQDLTFDRSAARDAVSSISPETDILNLGAGIDSAAALLNESGRDNNNWYIFTIVRAPSFDDPIPAVERAANESIPTYMIVYAKEERE